MPRLDDPAFYNPYGWRLADLDDPATNAERRRQLHDDLLVWEAHELAHGHRHLTVVHGAANTLEDSRDLDGFYDTIRDLAARSSWARVRGTGDYVTITVRGADAEEQITRLAGAAEAASRGRWNITLSAYAHPAG
ncbi:MAG: hypothetical protein M5T61_16090 [Acidimicrobiia bacterium]|jgi:hypothetical protein|nr:hypothetical protein [Acidimicrobiia bacterium]